MASFPNMIHHTGRVIKTHLPPPPPLPPLPPLPVPLEAVKSEVEDLWEEYLPLPKRSRLLLPHNEQRSSSRGASSSMGYNNMLDEPSPLGLRLKKSPSFLELLQMKLNSSTTCVAKYHLKMKDVKSASGSNVVEKMKASNFSASILKIGNWECLSRYEGDLVAKCYYAKQKLVWEVLDGGLKSKIEIQWSDIAALAANFPQNGPGTLDVVLSRVPQFYKETNPQPRKHTLWQSTSDFTDGQASRHRRHFLQCHHGILNKHFEKLIQCDSRLNSLSRQPEIILESPYFELRPAPEDQDDLICLTHGNLNDGRTFQGFLNEPVSPCATSSTSTRSGLMDSISGMSDLVSQEIHSPSSVLIDTRASEENLSSETGAFRHHSSVDQIGFPSIRHSISVQDLVLHMEHRISETPNADMPSKGALEEIAQHLLGDIPTESEGNMSRVNSFCTFLLKDTDSPQPQEHSSHRGVEPHANFAPAANSDPSDFEFDISQPESNEGSSYMPIPYISRNDSIGDLLMDLPRIASIPRCLSSLHDDGENQAW